MEEPEGPAHLARQGRRARSVVEVGVGRLGHVPERLGVARGALGVRPVRVEGLGRRHVSGVAGVLHRERVRKDGGLDD